MGHVGHFKPTHMFHPSSGTTRDAYASPSYGTYHPINQWCYVGRILLPPNPSVSRWCYAGRLQNDHEAGGLIVLGPGGVRIETRELQFSLLFDL
jgi:hypothetical protein